jgi:galactose mutarotase-like enzyme
MMVHHLQNDQYRVAVQEQGAELSSFRSLQQDLEYIWTADPAIWPRHAPVLFPVVGKLPQGQYRYRGQTYALPQHGFARDEPFELVHQTDQALTLALTSSPKTLALYPFPFRLEISYLLQGNSLETGYRVVNTGPEELFFSIGAHPGFNCPLLPGEKFEDYYLAFEKPETASRYLLDQGLQNQQTQPVLAAAQQLPLRYELFEQDAIVLKGLQSQQISLRSRQHAHGLDFEFKGYPYFGIWTKEAGAPFICLEPWHGIASRVGDSGELTEKEGIIRLAAGADFSCSYTIRVY